MNQQNQNQLNPKELDLKGFSTYQGIFVNGKRINPSKDGAGRSDKRFRKINWGDFPGRSVLDLGCSNGMLAIEAKKHGASRVVGVERSDCVQTSRRFVKQLGLDVEFWQVEIEDRDFLEHCPKFDIIFYCAMMSWTVDAKKFMNWMDSHCRHVLYFETNSHKNVERQLKSLKDNTSFYNYKDLGDTSEDTTGPGWYRFFRCARHVRETNPVYENAPFSIIPIDQIDGSALRKAADWESNPRYINIREGIKRIGLKYPLAVIKMPNGRYRGVEGGKRFIALKELGYKQIPCKVITSVKDLHESFHEEKKRWLIEKTELREKLESSD